MKKLLSGGIAAVLIAVMTAAFPTVASASSTDTNAIYNSTNEYRVDSGLKPLVSNGGLDAVAQNWAEQMATENSMYHNPNLTAQLPGAWISGGENVAHGYPDPWSTVDGWMASAGHRANILNSSFTDIGVGWVTDANGETWAVQVFAQYYVAPTLPGAVDTPAVSALDTTSAYVTWSPPSDTGGAQISSYSVVLTDANTGAVQSATITGGIYSATFTGLQPGHTYNATVAATNSVGTGPSSNAGSGTLPALPPVATGAPAVNIVDRYTIGVSWAAPSYDGGAPVTSYGVDLVSVDGTESQSATVDGGTLSANFTTLTPNKQYIARVTAANGAGVSPVSPDSAAITAPQTAPTGAQNAAAALSSANSLTATWSAPAKDGGSAITGYNVSLVRASNGAAVNRTVGGTINSLLFEGLIPGESYTVSITAYNAVGQTTEVATTNAVAIPAVVPSAPAAPAVELTDVNQLTATWSAPSYDGGAAISGYTVTATPNTGSPVTVTTDASTLTAVISNLSAGKTYKVTISAINVAGNSPASAASESIKFPAIPTPADAVTNFKASLDSTTSATFTWVEPEYNGGSKIDSYTIVLKDNDGFYIDTIVVDGETFSATYDALDRKTAYTATIFSTNSIGDSDDATAKFATLADAPSQVDAPTATAASGTSVDLEWSAPNDDGGSAITDYLVTVYNSEGTKIATSTVDGDQTSTTITGLTNGTAYAFSVVANNVDATSPESIWSSPVTTWNTPSAPATVNASLTGTRTISVNWTPSASDNGSAVTSYRVTLTPSTGEAITWTAEDGELAHTFTKLTNGVSYTATVEANNSVGWSTPTASTSVTVPAVAPDAPTNVTASLAPYAVAVSWEAPADNGGSAITGYTVTITDEDGGTLVQAVAGDVTNYTFESLTPGTKYTAKVEAQNTAGTSDASDESNEVSVPADAPDAPAAPTATLESANAIKVDWVAPAFDGGETITGYKVTLKNVTNGTSTAVELGDVLTKSFVGLTPGSSYIATVSAKNAAGFSAVSADSVPVTVPAVAPSAPAAPTVAVSGTSATVTWAAPSNNGGAPVTEYQVSFKNETSGNVETRNVSAKLSTVFTGLTPGSTYTATVAAINSAGQGASSVKSADAKVAAVAPTAPGASTITLTGATTANVSYTAPVFNGGATITDYRVTLTNSEGSTVKTAAGLTQAFTGLTPGSTYTAKVEAKNSVGWSASSANSAAVTVPAVAPSAPKSVEAVITAPGTVKVTWVAPTTDGGSPITGYTVNLTGLTGAEPQVAQVAANKLTATFTGLTPGQAYDATVTATNAVGSKTSAATPAVNIPAVAPDAPAAPVVTVTDGNTLSVTWNAPAFDGGATVGNYKVNLFTEGSSTPETVTVTTLSHAFTNLLAGTNYTVTVQAGNSVGFSVPSGTTAASLPVIAPDAVEAPVATASEGAVTVTWKAPTNNGAAAHNVYTVRLTQGESVVAEIQTDDLTATFEGLQNVTAYKVTVVATNEAGDSPASAPSNEVTTPAVAPSEPTDVAASILGSDSVYVSWTAPENNGGSEVTGYTVTLTPVQGQAVTKDVTDTNYTFEGLTPGATYTATVTATNEAGTSVSSRESGQVTVPATIPAAPTGVNILNAGNGKVRVNWVVPSNNGGANITEYIVTLTSNDGTVTKQTVTNGMVSAVFTNVPEETAVYATVVAVNSAGQSPSSERSATIMLPPVTAPTPVDSETLTPATQGGIILVNQTADSITVRIPSARLGDWVYGYAYSTPAGLGWTQVGINNEATWSLADAGLAAGDHKLTVQGGVDRALIGWVGFSILAPVVPVDPSNPATPNPETVTPAPVSPASTEEKKDEVAARNEDDVLSSTGADVTPYGSVALMLLVAGGALIFNVRRRRLATVSDTEEE